MVKQVADGRPEGLQVSRRPDGPDQPLAHLRGVVLPPMLAGQVQQQGVDVTGRIQFPGSREEHDGLLGLGSRQRLGVPQLTGQVVESLGHRGGGKGLRSRGIAASVQGLGWRYGVGEARPCGRGSAV